MSSLTTNPNLVPGRCCPCGCPHCGQGSSFSSSNILKQEKEENVVKIFVCAFRDCFFQSKNIEEVFLHRKNAHVLSDDVVRLKKERVKTQFFDHEDFLPDDDSDDDDGRFDTLDLFDDDLEAQDDQKLISEFNLKKVSVALKRLNPPPGCEMNRPAKLGRLDFKTAVLDPSNRYACKVCNFQTRSDTYRAKHKGSARHKLAVKRWKEGRKRIYFCGSKRCSFKAENPFSITEHQKSSHLRTRDNIGLHEDISLLEEVEIVERVGYHLQTDDQLPIEYDEPSYDTDGVKVKEPNDDADDFVNDSHGTIKTGKEIAESDSDEEMLVKRRKSRNENKRIRRRIQKKQNCCDACVEFSSDDPAELSRHKEEAHLHDELHCGIQINSKETDRFKNESAMNADTAQNEHKYDPSQSNQVESGLVTSLQICSFRTSNEKLLRSHRSNVHFTGEHFSNTLNEHCQKLIQVTRQNKKKSFSCLRCDYRTEYTHNAEVHVSSHHLQHILPVLCPLCDFRTGHTALLKVHIKDLCNDARKHRFAEGSEKLEPGSFPAEHCPHCNFETTSGKPDLDKHISISHGTTNLTCDECSFETNLQSHLNFHIRKAHLQKPNPITLCDLCGYNTEGKFDLARHKATMHGSYLCDKCDFQTGVHLDFVRHVKFSHKETCPQCKHLLNSEETMDNHECPVMLGPGVPDKALLNRVVDYQTGIKTVKKLNDNTFLCLECGLNNSKLVFMKTHVRLNHSDFNCHLCEYKGTNRPILNKHLKIWHQLRCEACKKTFKSEVDLTEHACSGKADVLERISATATVITCPECNFQPTVAKNLRRHIDNVHRKKKRAKCPICDMQFSENSNMQKHFRSIHQGEKQHKCPLCDFQTAFSHSFRKHVATHGDRDFRCEFDGCGFSTTAWGTMIRHKREVHRGVKEAVLS